MGADQSKDEDEKRLSDLSKKMLSMKPKPREESNAARGGAGAASSVPEQTAPGASGQTRGTPSRRPSSE